MNTRVTAAASVAGAFLVLGTFAFERGAAQPSNAPKKPAAAPAKPAETKPAAEKPGAEKPAGGDAGDRSADEKAIIESAEKFVEAFNAHDAKAACEQFLPNAEYVNSDGEAYQGRDAIQKDLEAFFKDYPKAKIAMQVDSIRFVGPRVAIEEGHTAVTLEPDTPAVVHSYLAVDLNLDGQWKIGSIRESLVEDEPATPHDHLQPLAWLVGDWLDESDQGLANTSCRWSDDDNYLLQRFHLQIAGVKLASGEQRIGWDPLTGQIKSWVFDSAGGYSEALWTWNEAAGHWLIKAHGVRPDGTIASATNILTPRSAESYIFQSTDRVAGGESEPDVRVVVVRRPPAPNK